MLTFREHRSLSPYNAHLLVFAPGVMGSLRSGPEGQALPRPGHCGSEGWSFNPNASSIPSQGGDQSMLLSR